MTMASMSEAGAGIGGGARQRVLAVLVGRGAPWRECRRRGFTLIELLAVIAIMATLMGLLGIGVAQMTSQSARKSAVNQVMNSFEQARVEALRIAVSVYVAFANGAAEFDADQRYRAFAVFRDRLDGDPPGAPDPLPLTKWRQLPRGISFKSNAGTAITAGASREFQLDAGRTVNAPCIEFNQTGMITSPPPGSGDITLYLYEGYYGDGGDRVTMNSSSTLFEMFSFARFTGRIRHEVTGI